MDRKELVRAAVSNAVLAIGLLVMLRSIASPTDVANAQEEHEATIDILLSGDLWAESSALVEGANAGDLIRLYVNAELSLVAGNIPALAVWLAEGDPVQRLSLVGYGPWFEPPLELACDISRQTSCLTLFVLEPATGDRMTLSAPDAYFLFAVPDDLPPGYRGSVLVELRDYAPGEQDLDNYSMMSAVFLDVEVAYEAEAIVEPTNTLTAAPSEMEAPPTHTPTSQPVAAAVTEAVPPPTATSRPAAAAVTEAQAPTIPASKTDAEQGTEISPSAPPTSAAATEQVSQSDLTGQRPAREFPWGWVIGGLIVVGLAAGAVRFLMPEMSRWLPRPQAELREQLPPYERLVPGIEDTIAITDEIPPGERGKAIDRERPLSGVEQGSLVSRDRTPGEPAGRLEVTPSPLLEDQIFILEEIPPGEPGGPTDREQTLPDDERGIPVLQDRTPGVPDGRLEVTPSLLLGDRTSIVGELPPAGATTDVEREVALPGEEGGGSLQQDRPSRAPEIRPEQAPSATLEDQITIFDEVPIGMPETPIQAESRSAVDEEWVSLSEEHPSTTAGIPVLAAELPPSISAGRGDAELVPDETPDTDDRIRRRTQPRIWFECPPRAHAMHCECFRIRVSYRDDPNGPGLDLESLEIRPARPLGGGSARGGVEKWDNIVGAFSVFPDHAILCVPHRLWFPCGLNLLTAEIANLDGVEASTDHAFAVRPRHVPFFLA